MKFGLFSNSTRFGSSPRENYEADLAEIVAADQAGFEEAWISEHLGVPTHEFVTVPELLIAKATALTDTIRLGAGVRLPSLYHPLDVANSAAFNDHLSGGRYNLGLGTGFAGVRNLERRGISGDDRRGRTLEALEFITRLWESVEPFDFDGQYYSGRDIFPEPRPLQQPHPPITVAAGQELTKIAAERGYDLLFSHWDTPDQLRAQFESFLHAADAAGNRDPRSHLKVSRVVYLAEDTATAREEARAGLTREFEWRRDITPHQFKGFLRGDETVRGDLNYDVLTDRGAFLIGDPDKVTEELNALAESLGGFGSVLLIGGKDISTAAGRQRSFELFAREVAPRLVDHNLIPA